MLLKISSKWHPPVGKREGCLDPGTSNYEGIPCPGHNSISGVGFWRHIDSLSPGTPGNTALDLLAREQITLIERNKLTKIPIGIWGPLPTRYMGLILVKAVLTYRPRSC